MRQQFATINRLRLEVAAPWPGLPNLITSPYPVNAGVQDASQWYDGSVSGSSGVLTPRATGLGLSSPVTPALTFTAPIPLPAGATHVRAQMRRVSGPSATPSRIVVYFLDANDALVTGPVSGADITAAGVVALPQTAIHPDAKFIRLGVRLGGTAPAAEVVFGDLVLIAGPSAAVAASPLTVEPAWVDVTGQTMNIETDRSELQVGTLTANIADSALDPARVDLVRPGRACRLRALVGGTWQQLLGGKIRTGVATYDYTSDDQKSTRVALTVVDPLTALAGIPRPDGVATIDELRWVLAGTGVPWVINGSRISVPPASVTVVSHVDQAMAVDQVAITRDSARGYAWLDRRGVLQAWDANQISTSVAATLDETDYSAIDPSFDPSRSINTVTVKHLRLDPATGETEEVTFGPYVDHDAARTWGPQPREFTVHGVDEDDVPAYAEDILAASATPQVSVSTLTLPLRTVAELEANVLRDLYDLVRVVNGRGELAELLRVVSVKHRITGTRWSVELGFAPEASVAPPQVTPSPTQNAGPTVAQRLRPVGEVTPFYGTVGQVPAGWLVCDGAAYDTAAYPRLHAHLQAMVTAGVHTNATLLPNFVDRFPIGAGVKAVGSSGGAATKPVPPHSHDHNLVTQAPPAAQTQNMTPRTTGSNNVAGPGHTHALTGGVTGVTAGAAAFDVMPPWRAIYFIIRAA
jgi:microcystin-dependent protein